MDKHAKLLAARVILVESPSTVSLISSCTARQRPVGAVRLAKGEPTSALRISFEESLVFERVHEESYRTFGYQLIDVPADDLARRVAAVGSLISS